MMLIITLGLLYATVAYGAMQYQARQGRLYTFLVDPPTMLLVGFVGALIGLRRGKRPPFRQEEFRKRAVRVNGLLSLFILGFWCLELSSYFNVRYASFLDFSKHPFDPTRTGNDFMMNGYVEWLTGPIYHGPFPLYDHWWSWPFLLVMLWLQLMCLRFGRALGYQTAFFNDPDNWSDAKREKQDG